MSAAELAVVKRDINDETMLKLVSEGDCARLSSDQRLQYYKARCDAAGLDPRSTPFQFIKLQGKEILYATKACTDQLTKNNKLTAKIVDQRTEDGIRIVSARITNPEGREVDDIGAVSVKGLSGDALCNALMKAVTKAKRRAILSFCGLGMLDETELETIPSSSPLPARPVATIPPPVALRSDPWETEAQYANEPPPFDTPMTDEPPAVAPKAEHNGSGNLISEPQRKRLYAIARCGGCTDADFKAELERMGYHSSKEVTREAYEDVVTYFQNLRK